MQEKKEIIYICTVYIDKLELIYWLNFIFFGTYYWKYFKRIFIFFFSILISPMIALSEWMKSNFLLLINRFILPLSNPNLISFLNTFSSWSFFLRILFSKWIPFSFDIKILFLIFSKISYLIIFFFKLPSIVTYCESANVKLFK